MSSPIFVIGCARSGTTLLTDLLRWHPALSVFPGEANEYWHPAVYPWRRSELEVPPYWVDPWTFTETSLQERREWTGERLRALFGWYRRLSGGAEFLNKSVMINFMLEWVVESFPGARFVHLLRDGRSATLSLARRKMRKFDLAPEKYDRYADMTFTEALVIQARHWSDCVGEIDRQAERLGLSEQGRLLELRYEDFVANPQPTVEAALGFAGLEAQAMKDVPPGAVKDMNVKAKKELDPEHLAAMMQVLEPMLQAKGYL